MFNLTVIRRSFYVFLLFYIFPFKGFAQNMNTLNDSTILNNAALSMRYYEKYYGKPSHAPISDSAYWENTVIILNNNSFLSKKAFLNLDKNKIISIKEILNPDTGQSVKRVLLLKTQ